MPFVFKVIGTKEVSASQTWRTVLGKIIRDPHERQRLAQELQISAITLTRWASGISTPRPQNLHSLVLFAPPKYRDLLITLLEQDFEGLSALGEIQSENNEIVFIPVEFYTRVLHTCSETSKNLLFQSLCDLILQQCLKQLDPYRVGMAITIARCMPPRGGKVQSLREVAGRGTSPWNDNLDQQGILLGAESLAGHTVFSQHLETNQHLQERLSVSPGYQSQWEHSAVAMPIMRTGTIAGSLLVSSTQSDYFLPTISKLIERYAELIALAFDASDFYEPKQIALSILPPFSEQQPYFVQFRKRVVETLQQATREQKHLTILQAEQRVWQQIEDQLLSQE